MRAWKPLTATFVASVVLLAGCTSQTPSEDPMLAELGLGGLSGQEIVDQLDASTEARPLDFVASVREDAVLLGDGTTEVLVPLPDDVYYVSIAPFVENTHECYFHSLATCQGELVDESVQVRITDADGDVLIEETATTYTNGFVGYWLPRDIEGTIEISQGDLTGSVPFSTSEGDPTCVTTLQLA
jgi:hypothetical protein